MTDSEPRRGGQGRDWHFRVPDNQDIAQSTTYSLGAARYHWGGMRRYLERMNEDGAWGKDGPAKNGQIAFNNFYHHLRAFFWELTSAFDTLLQFINRKYELGLDQRAVRWDTISKALSERSEHKKLLRDLTSGYNSAWYTDVREYRNFAHRGTVVAEVFWYPPDPVDPADRDTATSAIGISLLAIGGSGRGSGEPIAMCKDYGSKVQSFIYEVLAQIGEPEAATKIPEPGEADAQTQ